MMGALAAMRMPNCHLPAPLTVTSLSRTEIWSMGDDSDLTNTPWMAGSRATIMLPWIATSSLERHWMPVRA